MRILLILLLAPALLSQPAASPDAHALIERWRTAVLSGNPAAIRALAGDPSQVQVKAQDNPNANFDSEISHWADLKKHGLISVTPELVEQQSPQPGVTVLNLNVALKSAQGGKISTRYEQDVLGYRNVNGAQQLAFIGRSKPSYIKPLKGLDPTLYDEQADARLDIAHSLKLAKVDHKRTLLVFGANWCYDCDVLDAFFHQPDIAPVLKRGYRVIHVDIGQGEKNADLTQKYQMNIEHGVPALAILDSKGDLLFHDKGGEFSAARTMDPDVILAFLKKWRPAAK
ncbi:MAG: thioredoxin family protein [Acidobacteriaceae bacterium]